MNNIFRGLDLQSLETALTYTSMGVKFCIAMSVTHIRSHSDMNFMFQLITLGVRTSPAVFSVQVSNTRRLESLSDRRNVAFKLDVLGLDVLSKITAHECLCPVNHDTNIRQTFCSSN